MRVLITGASSGIGKSFAMEYAKRGYDLVLVSRSCDKLESVKKSISNNINIEIEVMDLADISNCKKLFNKYSDIDILINNAGFGLFGEFVNTDLDKEIQMIDTNIRAMHVLLKLYLQEMVKRDSGKILTVASIAGFMPGPLMATYYASKNYVVKLNEGIREELRVRGSNVGISILCPGPVKTNFDDVANVEFSLKGMSSDDVVRYALDRFDRNKFYIIPGMQIKMLKFMSKLMPIRFLSKVVYKSQKRKINV